MHAYRSSIRLFVVGVIGLILIIAALDIMFYHWLSTPPDGADTALTTRGQAQQRGDMLWGASLIGMGVILFGSSLIELVRRKPVVDVRDDGLQAQIGAQAPGVDPLVSRRWRDKRYLHRSVRRVDARTVGGEAARP